MEQEIIHSTQTPTVVSDRLSYMRLNAEQGKFLVTSAYASNFGVLPIDKEIYYNQLEDLLKNSVKKESTVIFGDFNARVESDPEA